MHARFFRFSTLLLLLVLLVACGGDAVQPTSAPAEPSPVSSAPTDVSQLTATLVPAAPTAVVTADPTEEPNDEVPTPERSSNDIGASGEGSADTSGEYVADFGFRPDYNGFSFENYGGESDIINLTEVEVQRMFGDQVCAVLDGDACTLTPAGQQWMDSINEGMSGGHCEGMAVLSSLLYTGKESPDMFGADSVPELELYGNEDLQREIAYWFTTQATQPARLGIVQQTPSGVVNTLLNALAAGPEGSETYAVGIYKRDGTGGHAITPYAVEDRGDGIYWIMVYDNNYPGAARAIEVDTNADTWYYSGSTNPDEPADDYEGDAETYTLELAPIEPRLEQQDCPFCSGEDGEDDASKNSARVRYNEVWLEGDADLLITDLDGNSIGFENGTFVNTIPGARSNATKFGVNVWNENAEPVYYIPLDIDFTISIDGTRLEAPTTSTVTLIGPGYVLEVSDIVLDPGQVDILDVAPDGSLLSYRTTSSQTPVLLVGIETDAADYLFLVQGYELQPDEAINLMLNTEEGWLSLDSIDNTDVGTYVLLMAKYDEQGEQIFGAGDITLNPDDVVYVDYLLWPGNGEAMHLDIDEGGDGEVDATLQIDDITDEIDDEGN